MTSTETMIRPDIVSVVFKALSKGLLPVSVIASVAGVSPQKISNWQDEYDFNKYMLELINTNSKPTYDVVS